MTLTLIVLLLPLVYGAVAVVLVLLLPRFTRDRAVWLSVRLGLLKLRYGMSALNRDEYPPEDQQST